MLRKIPGEVFSVPGPCFRSRVSLRKFASAVPTITVSPQLHAECSPCHSQGRELGLSEYLVARERELHVTPADLERSLEAHG